jgi:endonuclease/exonuclease/phosphatase family metal-dependent hydrolase
MTWGNRFPRIVTWVRLADRVTGATFYVYNTHWDHESAPARMRSASLLRERIATRAARADPVLVIGDFNAGDDDPAVKGLIAPPDDGAGAPGLADTFRAVHPAAQGVGTYHAFRGDRGGAKIDAVFASPEWRVLDAGIVHLADGGRYPSDHFPVTATLELRR